MHRLILKSAFFVLLMGSCIEPIEVEPVEGLSILVVEGSITTQPGPHLVKISRSATYGSVFDGVVRNETSALVRIRDDAGRQSFLNEVRPGKYQTPDNFQAEVGRSYTLLITTLDDENYISQPETIVQAPAIGTLELEYSRTASSESGGFRSGVKVFSQWQDPGDQQNFYLWKNSGTYLINTRPDLFVTIDGSGNRVPAPKACCAVCWLEESDADIDVRVFSDSRSNGNLNTELAAFIEDDGGRYNDKYLVRIEQQSISKEAYQFFNLLENQLSISGDIFDPPPATIRGNMINLEDPEAPVIGFFNASDVAVDSVFIPSSILQDMQQSRQVNDDCRTLPNSTDRRPTYW